MNIPSIIVLAVIILCVVLAAVMTAKKGRNSCGGVCSHCTAGCPNKTADDWSGGENNAKR